MSEEIKTSHKTRNIALIVAVLAIIAGAAFYFFWWLRSPQYSLKLIQEAVAQHDMDAFEKHVDVNGVNSQAIDDMVTATISPDDAKNPLLATMITMVKNTALPYFNSQMRTYVQTGSFAPVEGNSEGGQIAAATAARTGLENLSVKSIGRSERQNDRAQVNCVLWDSKLEQEFNLKVAMERLPDNTWKLMSITNLGEFLIAHDDAVTLRLSKLNEPISADIDKRVAVVKDGSKPYIIQREDQEVNGIPVYKLKTQFSFKILDPAVIGVRGNVEVYDAQKQAIFSRAFDSENKDLSTGDGVWSFADEWRLNGFDTMDKKLIGADMSTCTTGIVFTGIKLKDGKEIKFLTELPE